MASYLPKNIWLISDGRPGHETQLIGLGERIQALSGANLHWHHLKSKKLEKNLRHIENSDLASSQVGTATTSHQKTEHTTCSPDLLIAAGHRTHRTLYFLARKHKAFSTVLMKPSLPLAFFNAVICPIHDGLKPSERVFNTDGVINKVQPSVNTKIANQNSILLGGPSKHFAWDEGALITQISDLLAARPASQWSAYESPRTPPSLSEMLGGLSAPNLTLMRYGSLPPNALQTALRLSQECWVTPDSASMVYESLTAGCATATFVAPPKRTKKVSRVARGLQSLLADERISQWPTQNLSSALPENSQPLWEADRAAKWLLDRFQAHSSINTVEQH